MKKFEEVYYMGSEIKYKMLAKREHDKELVFRMISIYCKNKHKTQLRLCNECEDLYNYAIKRLANCPFTETKTFCSSCPVHCYSPEMREKIRQVMRFSGPRLIFYSPRDVVFRLVDTFRNLKLGAKT